MIFSLHFTWIELYSINFKSCCIEGQHRIRYGEQASAILFYLLAPKPLLNPLLEEEANEFFGGIIKVFVVKPALVL